MTTTAEDDRIRDGVHMAWWLPDYTAGRLEPGREGEVESHLLVCDACFAALVAIALSAP